MRIAYIKHYKINNLKCMLALFILSGFYQANAENSLSLAQVQENTYPVKRYLDATIEAVHQATVSAQTSGRITSISVDTDDNVEKGMVMITLRDKDQRAAFKAAKGNVEEARSENDRVKKLYEQKLVAKALLDKSEARLKSAHAAYEKADEELENTIIRAPYSGIVVKRHVEVGEMARIGYPLITGLSLEKLRATVEVPQSLIHVVRQQKSVSVLIDAEKNQIIKSNDITISPYADVNSHSFTMRLNLPAGEFGLYPGMFVKVVLIKGEKQYMVIPSAAVVQRGELTLVYVVDSQQRLYLRNVRLGQTFDSSELIKPAVKAAEDGQTEKIIAQNTGDSAAAYVEVLAGLNSGENVVLDPIKAIALIKQQGASGNE